MSEVNTSMTKEEAEEKHWYIKINKRESGPYRFEEILLMINGSDIKESDMITCRGMGGWEPLKEFSYFTPKAVKAHFEENEMNPDDQENVHFRKTMRVPLMETVLTLNGNQLFKAHCIDVSTGGCMIKVPRGKVPIDSTIKVHIYKNDKKNLPSFNLKGSVIRIIPIKERSDCGNFFDHVGVEFTNGNKSHKDNLQETLRNLIFNFNEDEFKMAIENRTAS